jgi:hypothetical protein
MVTLPYLPYLGAPFVIFLLAVRFLPGLIVRIRNIMLTRINGDSGVQVRSRHQQSWKMDTHPVT